MFIEPECIEGEADFVVASAGKPCKTTYWISGATHYYVSILTVLTNIYGIPVVLYDQLGGGHSTHLPEKDGDTGFWTTQLFIDELENLLNHLGIHQNFDLLGHSWGAMLAASFATQRPKGLRRLVLASGVARMQDWMDSADGWKSELPKDVQNTLNKHEQAGTTDSKEYEAAVSVFYAHHLCRISPMPDGMIKDIACMEEDTTVYHTMYV